MSLRKIVFLLLLGGAFVASSVSVRVSFEAEVPKSLSGLISAALLVAILSASDGIILGSMMWLFKQAPHADPHRIANALTLTIPTTLAYSALIFMIFRGTQLSTIDLHIPSTFFSVLVVAGTFSLFLRRLPPTVDRRRNWKYWGFMILVGGGAAYLGLNLHPSDIFVLLPLGVAAWVCAAFDLSARTMKWGLEFAAFGATLAFLLAWFCDGYISASAGVTLVAAYSVLLVLSFSVLISISRVEGSIAFATSSAKSTVEANPPTTPYTP